MAIRAAAGWATVLGLGLAAPASVEGCRLALVLALDISGSVDANEIQLQRNGLAYALLYPEVTRAFLEGDPVALFVFEWASPGYQSDITSDWHLVRTEEDLMRVATALQATRERESDLRPGAGSTALGQALVHAAEVLERNPRCRARTVDISGDGANNLGPAPQDVYERPLLARVTVNALVVGGALDSRGQPVSDGHLVAWFEAEVLHGPGAFWILADGYEDYERAMTVKLLRELELPMMSGSAFPEPTG